MSRPDSGEITSQNERVYEIQQTKKWYVAKSVIKARYTNDMASVRYGNFTTRKMRETGANEINVNLLF